MLDVSHHVGDTAVIPGNLNGLRDGSGLITVWLPMVTHKGQGLP